jgi:MFS family permease
MTATLTHSGAVPHVPETPADIKVKLSIMMFLQYAIWGAWLPLFYFYLTGYLAIPPLKAGLLFSIAAVGALLAPFIAGQIADRWFNTEKFLALSHVAGAGLVWVLARVETWNQLAVFGLLYSLVYAPTLALTNSLAFHHLVDRDRDFGKVRVWGTIGWIAVGIGVGQWLYRTYTPQMAPLALAWTTQANSAAPLESALGPMIRTALEADVAIAGVKDNEGNLIREGAVQALTRKGSEPTPEAAKSGAADRAARGAPSASKALSDLGWEIDRADQAAARVATAVARQELTLRSGDNPPSAGELNTTLAETAARAVQNENQVRGMRDSLRLSAVLGLLMGVYCLMLPRTPPRQGREPFAAKEALQEVVNRRALTVLFLLSFPIGCVHQFYFLQTAPFITSLNINAAFINNIFGVGGAGLMTIGQISEIVVLALVPFFAKRFPRKTFLTVGLLAYILRFFVFAYLPKPWAVIPALALHGVCFGCFFFIAFMIVDEMTTKDVRASAQGLYNLVVVGLGTIVGNLFTGYVGTLATRPDRTTDFQLLFSIPMWIVLACLALLLLAYPRHPRPAEVALAAEPVGGAV